MVDAYLERYAARAKVALQPLDANGCYTDAPGSATIGVNVPEDHGVLHGLARDAGPEARARPLIAGSSSSRS